MRSARSEPVPNQIIDEFRLTETINGRVFYDLNAERAYVFEDSQRIEVTRPQVRFYDEQHNLTSVLTAEAGSVNSKTSDLVARTRVRVANQDSTVLETDSLVWRNRDQLVITDAEVNMRSPSGDVRGIGLVSDAGLKRIEIRQTVSATTNYEFQQR
jgi:LPS export ABC transporter protein LptC